MAVASNKSKQLATVLMKFYDRPIAKVSMELVFTITAVIVFAMFAIRPTIATMGKLIKELEDKEALNQRLAEKQAALTSASRQFEVLRDRLTILDEALPSTPKFDEALLIIEKLASESKLTISSIQAKEVPKEPINDVPFAQKSRVTRPVAITVTGDYPGIRQFIENIQGTRRALAIDTVVFTIIEQRSRKVLQATITVNVPFFAFDQTKSDQPPAPVEGT
jgi:Tfp pilus assembly protein PilO